MSASRRMVAAVALLASFVFAFPCSSPAQTRDIEVDFSKVIGKIKPLNGLCGRPIVTRGAFDLSSNFIELGIKHFRLHDIPWQYENVVDTNYVFPRSEADVNDPHSYDFPLTDYYLKSIVALGAEMTYRLGYSAYWKYHPRVYDVPLKDCAKWAAIGAHIARHYNQGWANGYHYNIKRWEVWNEPDGEFKDIPQEFYKLYEATAKALKSVDPSLKVGGPALAGRMDFLDGLLKYCADRKVPLDFLSWHIYARQPQEVISLATNIQTSLDKYGFSKVESILDEWNYGPFEWSRLNTEAKYRKEAFLKMAGPPGAAFDASVLMHLQDTTVAIADFYSGTNFFWGGLFDAFGVPNKAYYAFKAFKFLLDTPDRVITSGSDANGFAAMAGLSKDKSGATILISNFGTEYGHYNISLRGLPWKNGFTYEKYMVDGRYDLDLVKSEKLGPGMISVSEDVETPSVCMIRLRSAH